MRALNNKALAVLGVLREHGGELTCHAIADAVRERTPCGECDGTGEGDGPRGCRRCYGRGQYPFWYSDAYVALRKLLGRGLVTCRHPVDEFGDQQRTYVWSALDADTPADPLEVLFLAPSAKERD